MAPVKKLDLHSKVAERIASRHGIQPSSKKGKSENKRTLADLIPGKKISIPVISTDVSIVTPDVMMARIKNSDSINKDCHYMLPHTFQSYINNLPEAGILVIKGNLTFDFEDYKPAQRADKSLWMPLAWMQALSALASKNKILIVVEGDIIINGVSGGKLDTSYIHPQANGQRHHHLILRYSKLDVLSMGRPVKFSQRFNKELTFMSEDKTTSDVRLEQNTSLGRVEYSGHYLRR